MGIVYARLSIAIHGLNADGDALSFLVGWLREATRAGLKGTLRNRFGFRDEYDSDIEVDIEETAGNTEAQIAYLADRSRMELDAARWRWLREQEGWPETECAASGQSPEWFDRLADEKIHPQPNT